MMTPEHGKAEGEARKAKGMSLAAMHRERCIKAAMLAMIDAGLKRADRTYSSDDISGDLANKYASNGPWVGAAVRMLATAGIGRRAGYTKSARPSRHGAEVKLWQIVDDQRAEAFREELRLALGLTSPQSTTTIELTTEAALNKSLQAVV